MESTTIPKNTESQDDRDFEFLRREGQKHIEALSRKLWTDYNTHDPGITILEVLCYAITDLGHRINQPIQDLLTPPKETDKTLSDDFPTAKQILTTSPVSESDYRKLVIDLEGVNNAFIRKHTNQVVYSHCLQRDEASEEFPQGRLGYEDDLGPDYRQAGKFHLRGLNNILFEPTIDIRFLEEEERKERISEIVKAIKDTYHANRNLCEDLAEVKEVGYIDILVCGDLEIERNADSVEVLADILFNIQEHLSPSIKRYTLDQLLDRGERVEDIFEGPVLSNGFILDEELEKANIKHELHLSDLIQIVKETPGVKKIRALHMKECPCNGESPEPDTGGAIPNEEWTLCFPPDHDKVLRLEIDKAIRRTNIFRDVIPVNVDPEVVKQRLKKKVLAHHSSLKLSYDDLEIEKGRSIDTGHYTTVQNDLPNLYGTGEYGLSPSLPPDRHAKALQLKGYLLFFDQILATYFAHLKNAGSLLSADLGGQTYFANQVDNVKDFSKLPRDTSNYEVELDRIIADMDHFEERKNQFLDHLLARFAENMSEHAFLLLDSFDQNFEEALLWHKAKLLEEYPEISYRRPRGFNYYCEECEVWDTYNVSGLEHRLARLLGIRDYSRRNLTSYTYEFYQEEDEDELSEWRWRIRDDEGNIMFSSSMHYHNIEHAEEEMWATLSLAWDINNYRLLPTEGGDKFYFNLVDRDEEVVARHIQYYNSEEEARDDIERFSDYMFDKVSDEGMFLFEHILFRPDRDDPEADQKFMDICMDPDCKQCPPPDPYSLRLTIVFPGWTKRFSNLHFREFAENLIRSEVPAHILTRVCWIGNSTDSESGDEEEESGQMTQLEDLYKKWLTKKMEHPEDQKENEFLKPLVDLLHDLETVYPEGRLHDCESTGESKSSIVLGKSTIGELKEQENGNE